MSSITDMVTLWDPEFVITSSIVVILQMLDNRYTFLSVRMFPSYLYTNV